MPHIHILDLAENGVIKPHVDSSRVSLYEEFFGLQFYLSTTTILRNISHSRSLFRLKFDYFFHVKYCGSTIAGLSLLSDSVMRLVRTDETKYLQTKDGTNADEYRTSPKPLDTKNAFYADVLLKQRSLYIMRLVCLDFLFGVSELNFF